jgi:hypothetical protein
MMQLGWSWLLASWPRLLRVIGSLLVIVVLLIKWTDSLSNAPIQDDAAANLTMAYNFAMREVLSLDLLEQEVQDIGDLRGYPVAQENDPKAAIQIHLDDLRPTNYREPLPPIVLGIYLKVLELVHGPISFGSLIKGSGARLAKSSNVIWGILLCLSVFATLRVLTGTNTLAAVGALVIGLNLDLDSLYTDLPAAALLALASHLSMMAIKTRHRLYYLLTGLTMGALTLTKAPFLYVSLALVVCFVFWLISQLSHGIQGRAIGLALFVFGVTVVLAPWMGRNYYIFGTTRPSERGGVILMMRALYDQMNWTEYLGSFYAWAPEGSIRSALGKTLGFNEADLDKGGRLQRLKRYGFAEDLAAENAGLPEGAISYYRQARAERAKLERELQQLGYSHPESEADVELQNHAMKIILVHPIKHVLMTVPFLWRGAPFIAPLFAFFAAITIKRRRYDLIAYMLPAIAMVAFYAAASHNIPRFNEPAQPIAAVLAIEMVQALIIRTRRGLSSLIKSRV